MNVWCEIDVTRIRIDSWSGLADACFSWLFVGDIETVRRDDCLHSDKLNKQLSLQLAQLGLF